MVEMNFGTTLIISTFIPANVPPSNLFPCDT